MDNLAECRAGEDPLFRKWRQHSPPFEQQMRKRIGQLIRFAAWLFSLNTRNCSQRTPFSLSKNEDHLSLSKNGDPFPFPKMRTPIEDPFSFLHCWTLSLPTSGEGPFLN